MPLSSDSEDEVLVGGLKGMKTGPKDQKDQGL